MVFNDLCILVLWMKVALALEELIRYVKRIIEHSSKKKDIIRHELELVEPYAAGG